MSMDNIEFGPRIAKGSLVRLADLRSANLVHTRSDGGFTAQTGSSSTYEPMEARGPVQISVLSAKGSRISVCTIPIPVPPARLWHGPDP